MKCPLAPGYGAVLIQVHGPTGVSVFGSTPSAKMSFGPCPRMCAMIGARTNEPKSRKTMKPTLSSASRSRLNLLQTSSQ